MSPGSGQDQGQPTLFPPGRARNVFTTTYTGTTASWRLGNDTARSTRTSAACATKPVPQVGSVGALFVVALLLVLGALIIASARPRPLVVSE